MYPIIIDVCKKLNAYLKREMEIQPNSDVDAKEVKI